LPRQCSDCPPPSKSKFTTPGPKALFSDPGVPRALWKWRANVFSLLTNWNWTCLKTSKYYGFAGRHDTFLPSSPRPGANSHASFLPAENSGTGCGGRRSLPASPFSLFPFSANKTCAKHPFSSPPPKHAVRVIQCVVPDFTGIAFAKQGVCAPPSPHSSNFRLLIRAHPSPYARIFSFAHIAKKECLKRYMKGTLVLHLPPPFFPETGPRPVSPSQDFSFMRRSERKFLSWGEAAEFPASLPPPPLLPTQSKRSGSKSVPLCQMIPSLVSC